MSNEKCECKIHHEAEVDSLALFNQIKVFFEEQINAGVFIDIPVTHPYFVGYSDTQSLKWFAQKWYKCRNCGCLWEFRHPEFPACGFVRKFPDGNYREKEQTYGRK